MPANDTLYELAENIIAELPEPAERARLRKRFAVTQERLASAIGVSRRSVHDWENGKTEPTGTNREKYAQMLTLWQTREREEKNRQDTQK